MLYFRFLLGFRPFGFPSSRSDPAFRSNASQPSSGLVARKPGYSWDRMAASTAALVELGFAEEAPAWRLRSEQFPSKVGGRPAWLGLAELPGPRALACARCGRPLAFLLQVYAPLPGRADAFHRSLFLFCCREPPCCAGLRGERPGGRTQAKMR